MSFFASARRISRVLGDKLEKFVQKNSTNLLKIKILKSTNIPVESSIYLGSMSCLAAPRPKALRAAFALLGRARGVAASSCFSRSARLSSSSLSRWPRRNAARLSISSGSTCSAKSITDRYRKGCL
jgi:hypothetical protein